MTSDSVRSVRSFSTRRARTTTGSPPDRKDAPSQGGAVVWEPSTRAHPRLHTRQNRGLGFRSGRSPYLGALKYHVVAAAPSAARPPPYRRACPSVLRRPLRDALPPRSLAHLPPDVRGRRARDSPDLRAHLRPPRLVDPREHRLVRRAPRHHGALLARRRSRRARRRDGSRGCLLLSSAFQAQTAQCGPSDSEVRCSTPHCVREVSASVGC